jgi:ribonuclease HII
MVQDPYIIHLASKHKIPAYTDACGTGSIFGPIVACAMAFINPYFDPNVDDSKKLKHEEIYRLAPILKKKIVWALGVTSALELAALQNNLKGEHFAMTRAVLALRKKLHIDAVFVDGRFTLPETNIISYAVIRGDQRSFGVACASIIAKDARDHEMIQSYGNKYAKYHIAQNKGYRSPDHLMAIKKYGSVKFLHREYLPQIKKVLSGEYDSVIQKKYKNRWEKLCQA